MPTAHDMLMPMLVSLGEAPEYPDEHDPSSLRSWCECLLLLGQASYPVVLHDPATLARCVATLGGLLSRGVHSHITMPDGSVGEGKRSNLMHERVCWLKPGADWDCMKELILGVETAVKESREMLVKCHQNFTKLHKLEGKNGLLEMYRHGDRKATHLTPQEIRPLLERHYSVERCKEMKWFCDRDASEDEAPPKKTAYMRGTGRTSSTETFSIVAVTCALGRQLLLEHDKA